MRTLVTGILFLLLTAICHSQSDDANVKFIILDKENEQPCSFAHVSIKNSDKGGIADVEGTVYMSFQQHEHDSLLIQMVGYQSQSLAISNLRDTIFLSRSNVDMPEVVISSKRNSVKYGGIRPRKKKIPWVSSEMIGTEIGTYLNELPSDRTIDAVNVYFRKNRCDSILVRVRLYSAEKDNGWETQIDHPDILHVIRKQKGWIHIPIQSTIMSHPKMLVTIETIRTWGNKSGKPDFALCHDKKHPGLATSRRYSREDGWTNYSYAGKGLAIHLDLVE